MYTPPAFKLEELAEIHALMGEATLASLVTGAGGLMATPVPMFLEPAGEFGVLHGHLARANPQSRLPSGTEALAIFMGPDAYVTPSWYPTKRETGKVVPTWNYAAVHASGPLELYDDPQRLLEHLHRLTDSHEHPRTEPWSVSDAPESFIAGQLKGIVGFRLPIATLEAKRKMSQNRNAEDRSGVAAGLAASERAGDRLVAPLIPLDPR